MSVRARLGTALAMAALCGVAAGAQPARAAKKKLPESNLVLLDRTLSEVARRIVQQFPLAPGSRIALVKADETPLSLDAERAILEALTGRRMDVWLVPAPAAESAATPVHLGSADLGKGQLGSLSLTELQARQQQMAGQEKRTEVFDPGTGEGPGPGAAAPATLDLPLLTLRVEEARVDYPRLYRSGLFGGMHVERRALSRVSARLLRPGSRAVYWVGAADTSLADNVVRSDVRMLEDATRAETKGTVPSQSWQKVVEPVLVVALVAGLVSLFYTNRP